jgi:hypothetical protein
VSHLSNEDAEILRRLVDVVGARRQPPDVAELLRELRRVLRRHDMILKANERRAAEREQETPAEVSPYNGVAGVYVLHFERPHGFRRGDDGQPLPEYAGNVNEYGDAQHYVGQAGDIGRRWRQHRRGWAGHPTKGSVVTRLAGRLGIDFEIGAVIPENGGEIARIALERQITQAPAASCSRCKE